MKRVIGIGMVCIAILTLMACPHANNSGEGKVYEKPADVTSATVGLLKGIKGGSFLMGEDVQKTTRQTSVDSFLLAETEVTQAQWEAVMTDWPSASVPIALYGMGANRPAYYINWYDAVEFCNALSEAESLTKAYTITKTDENDHSTWTVTMVTGANGYRLPTEAEWEYAAGGGDRAERTFYAANITVDLDPEDLDGDNIRDENDGIDDNTGVLLSDYAWYSANNGVYNSSTPDPNYGSKDVKTKRPNTLGLYDMSGNVYEWCWDWYGSPYDQSETNNPVGFDSGSSRVSRGGSWHYNASFCRVAFRYSNTPSYRSSYIGFRVARSVAP